MKRRVLGLGLLLLAGGCASVKPAARLLGESEVDGKRVDFVARFDEAYFKATPDGQTDVILIAGALGRESTNEALRTDDTLAVTQVLHLRVLWRAKAGLTEQNANASNTSLDWCVFGSSNDNVRYGGAAYVRVRGSGDERTLYVQNATFKLSYALGADMADPIGAGRFEGTFTARRDEGRVDDYLRRLSDAKKPSARSSDAVGAPVSGAQTSKTLAHARG